MAKGYVRYEAKSKDKIIRFINSFNAKNGRGGVASASRKFKISQLTLSRWVKGGSSPKGRKVGRGSPGLPSGLPGQAASARLKKLFRIREKIDRLQREYKSLRQSLRW